MPSEVEPRITGGRTTAKPCPRRGKYRRATGDKQARVARVFRIKEQIKAGKYDIDGKLAAIFDELLRDALP